LNCLEFRRAVGADPSRLSAEAVAHRDSCTTCAKYAQEMVRLDGLIKRALEVPVPHQREFPVPAAARPLRQKWFAMAASVLLVVGVGIVVTWFGGTSQSAFAADIVKHLDHEAAAMTVSEKRVSTELLRSTLAAKGLQLVEPIDDVSYAQNCWVRKTFAPHLVVQTQQGPVAVIVFPAMQVEAPEKFDEASYHGQIMPMGKGSVVVVANDASVIDEVSAKVRKAIAWQ
jgi:hypothetical protein